MRHWVLCLGLLTAFAVGALAASCGGNEAEPDETSSGSSSTTRTPFRLPDRPPTEHELPIRIAVTLPLFEEFARVAGGDYVEVISLVPAGADPHTYEFTDADIGRMKGVDFFFLNDLGLDSRLRDVIERSRDEDAHVIPFAPNILSPAGDGRTAQQAGDNAHLWLDPSIAYVYVEIVADELVIYDGIHQDYYNANFTGFKVKMLAFQDELHATLRAVPSERRKLVTYHDAFDHFARKLDLEVAGYAVEMLGSPTAADTVSRLAGLIQEQMVPAVFLEYGYDTGLIDDVAASSGVPVCQLYSDIAPSDLSYEQIMRENAGEIVRCLGVE